MVYQFKKIVGKYAAACGAIGNTWVCYSIPCPSVMSALGVWSFAVLLWSENIHLAAAMRTIYKPCKWVVLAVLVGFFLLHALVNALGVFVSLAVYNWLVDVFKYYPFAFILESGAFVFNVFTGLEFANE